MAYVKGTQVGGGEGNKKDTNKYNDKEIEKADAEAAAKKKADEEAARQRAIKITKLKGQIEAVETELAELIKLKKEYENLNNGIEDALSNILLSSSSLDEATEQLQDAYTGFKAGIIKGKTENTKDEIVEVSELLNSIKQKADEKIKELKIKIENKEKELNTQLAYL